MTTITYSVSFVAFCLFSNLYTAHAHQCFECHDGLVSEAMPNRVINLPGCSGMGKELLKECPTNACYKVEVKFKSPYEKTGVARFCGRTTGDCSQSLRSTRPWKVLNFFSRPSLEQIEYKCSICETSECNAASTVLPTAVFFTTLVFKLLY